MTWAEEDTLAKEMSRLVTPSRSLQPEHSGGMFPDPWQMPKTEDSTKHYIGCFFLHKPTIKFNL